MADSDSKAGGSKFDNGEFEKNIKCAMVSPFPPDPKPKKTQKKPKKDPQPNSKGSDSGSCK